MIQFRGCVTNGLTESYVKEVIQKQLENVPNRKGGEKTQMMPMIEVIRPMLIKIWNCILGIILYGWTGSSWIHFQLGLSAQIFKVLAFEAVLFTFCGKKLSLKLSLKLLRPQTWRIVLVRPRFRSVSIIMN